LPFSDGTFDTVVSTFTLCSVEKPGQALKEVARVLAPGGRFLFLEHGLSPAGEVARWQRRLAPVQKCVAGGCRLTRDIAGLLAEAEFACVESCSFYLPETPRAFGYMTSGFATARA
jgi:SAM-dependent methyltransferase